MWLFTRGYNPFLVKLGRKKIRDRRCYIMNTLMKALFLLRALLRRAEHIQRIVSCPKYRCNRMNINVVNMAMMAMKNWGSVPKGTLLVGD